MDKKTISTMKKMFDDIMHTTEDGIVEFWYARELMGCLGYTTWRRFKDAINRAMESCKGAEIEVSDHLPTPSKWLRLVVMRCEMWMILCLLDTHVILLRKMEIQEKRKLLLPKVILLYRQENKN